MIVTFTENFNRRNPRRARP